MPKTPVKKSTSKKSEYKPIFDLYRDGLTQGSIATFLDCPEQFRLKYVFGWRPQVASGATAFGSAFHDILSSIQHSDDGGKLPTIDEATDRYYKSIQKNLTANQTEETLTMLALVKSMIAHYLIRWKKDDDAIKWVAREKTFHVKYDKRIPLRGRWDGIRKHKDGLYLHETKTKGRIDEEGIADSLPHDIQTQLYCWAIKQTYGEYPRGVVYDVIRNPQLRIKQSESRTDFVQRVIEDVESRYDWYYMRWTVTLTKSDLDRWESRFLNTVIPKIVNWWDAIEDNLNNPWLSEEHYMRPGAFWNQYGRTDLFHALTKGQYFGLEQRKIVYPELED